MTASEWTLSSEQKKTIGEIVEQCKPIFSFKGPPVQGCALGILVAVWLAGFTDPQQRALARETLNTMIDELIEAADAGESIA